jgi:hypothetical protein
MAADAYAVRPGREEHACCREQSDSDEREGEADRSDEKSRRHQGGGACEITRDSSSLLR